MQATSQASSSKANLSREEIQELVRSAALQEAARRLQSNHHQSPDQSQSNNQAVHPGSGNDDDDDDEDGRSAALLEAFEIERAKNDAAWNLVQKVSRRRQTGADHTSLMSFRVRRITRRK